MAKSTTCDGCGTSECASGFVSYGWFSPVDYCSNCGAIYEEFVKDRDDLHTDLANQWTGGIAKLRDKYRSRKPEMKFPDE